MHGATSDAPPQVFTFPRRPTSAVYWIPKDSEGGGVAATAAFAPATDGETSTDDETTAAAPAAAASSSALADQKNTSIDAVSGSHAGSGAAVSWSFAEVDGLVWSFFLFLTFFFLDSLLT